MARPEGERARRYTGIQVFHIESYKLMGKILSEDLASKPELRDELSRLIHQDPVGHNRIYEGTLRHYFYDGAGDFQRLVESPFVRAFTGTRLCTEAEVDFLSTLRHFAASTSELPRDIAGNFWSWLDRRLPLMARGLQMCILDSGVIPPLTPEEITRRRSELLKRSWIEHPEKYVESVRLATQASVENAGPRVFTDEVRAQMQRWFDQGHDYKTVAELLRDFGIETNRLRLNWVVKRYPDLHYTPGEIKNQQLQGFKEAVKSIFEATGSTKKTKGILEKLGYSQERVEHYLETQGLRNKVYWNEEVQIEGAPRRLNALIIEFASGNYPTVGNEYKAFGSFLEQKGVKLKFSFSSYRGVRKRILQQRSELV